MNRKDKRYFNLAKAVSYTSDYPRVHIGSVIIKNKEILAVSANQKKSHPLQQKLNPIPIIDTNQPHHALLRILLFLLNENEDEHLND